MLGKLIRATNQLLNKDSQSPIALHLATIENHQSKIKHLIKKGADVNAQDEYGRTPLFWGALKGYQTIVQYLVERGADVNIHDQNKDTPLHGAALNNHTWIIVYLIRKGAHVNAYNRERYTPLHAAAKECYSALVEYLLIEGAHVNADDKHGNTPLHWAAMRNYQNTAKCFLKGGADVNAQNQNGQTALYFAAKNKHIQTTQLLLEHGAYRGKDLQAEIAFETWIEQWKALTLISQDKILLCIKVLEAGIPISDEVLPASLKDEKKRIYKKVKEWLKLDSSPGEKQSISIPSVLCTLPKMLHWAKCIHEYKGPAIQSGYDTQSLQQYFFPNHEILKALQKKKEFVTFFEKLQRAKLPVELLSMIREHLRDNEIIETLKNLYALEETVYLWYKAKLYFEKYKNSHTQPLQPSETNTKRLRITPND